MSTIQRAPVTTGVTIGSGIVRLCGALNVAVATGSDITLGFKEYSPEGAGVAQTEQQAASSSVPCCMHIGHFALATWVIRM